MSWSSTDEISLEGIYHISEAGPQTLQAQNLNFPEFFYLLGIGSH